MDPASISAIGAVLGLLYQYGPWGVAVVVLYGVLRVWRTGEFLPKSTHDTIVAATTQRYLDLLERFNQGQEAIRLWREQAERAAKTAEVAQFQHTELLARVAEVRDEQRRAWEELRDALREYGPSGNDRSPGPGRRPGSAREGG